MNCNEILWRGSGWDKEELINIGGNMGLLRCVNEKNNSVIVVACPDRGAGNDPETLGLPFHQQGPTFINTYCQAATNLVDRIRINMEEMMEETWRKCLSKCLRSPSAWSSLSYFLVFFLIDR